MSGGRADGNSDPGVVSKNHMNLRQATLRFVLPVLQFAVACYLVAFGTAVLCCVPLHRSGGFWRAEKFFYGLLPICAALVIFLFAFRRWRRAFSQRLTAWLVGFAAVILIVFLDVIAFQLLRPESDAGINVVWNAESGTFSWGSGEVKLPPGFTYHAERGIDTFVGRFTSRDGKIVIEHDIGELAAEHLGMGNVQTISKGSRVLTGRAVASESGTTKFFAAVSFPDTGCANFYQESQSEKDLYAIELVRANYRPVGWMPSWVRPLLPELLRSDCRHRMTVPGRL